MLQTLAFKCIVPLVLVGAVYVALEVNHIPLGGQADVPENPHHLRHKAAFLHLCPGREPKVDVLRERVHVLPHGRYVNLLVHLQHLLEKAQVGILQHQEALSLADDPVLQKKAQPSPIPAQEMLQSLLPPQRGRLPAGEQEFEDLLLARNHPKQRIYVPECVHTAAR